MTSFAVKQNLQVISSSKPAWSV